MARHPCFFITECSAVELGISVWEDVPEGQPLCPGNGNPRKYHRASRYWTIDVPLGFPLETPSLDDPDYQWPLFCECGHPFTDDARRSSSAGRHYKRTDTGEIIGQLRNAPIGAMWYADWYDSFGNPGPDGRHLCVETPGGPWHIDGEASNCTRKGDKGHHCWIRHGVPPAVTVDKNGETCQAGAGSIQIGNYHGFLRAGFLED